MFQLTHSCHRPAFPQNALKEFAAQNGHFSVVLASLSVVTRFATLFSHYIMIIICNIFVRQHENNVHSHVTCFFVQGHWLPCHRQKKNMNKKPVQSIQLYVQDHSKQRLDWCPSRLDTNTPSTLPFNSTTCGQINFHLSKRKLLFSFIMFKSLVLQSGITLLQHITVGCGGRTVQLCSPSSTPHMLSCPFQNQKQGWKTAKLGSRCVVNPTIN